MGQPAHPEKTLLINACSLSSTMTKDSYLCQSPCCNLLPPIGEADKPAGTTPEVFTAGSNSPFLLYL